jgi:hypothetical protein
MAGLQVVLEEVADELRVRRAPSEPRALVRWALDRPHPVLAASFAEQSVSHSIHPNHLFWRIDENAVVAHYFNLFMFAVRPERTDFEIRAPLDFCFLIEMCPTGSIKVLDDSDDGFFVEVARRDHEVALLAPGGYEFGQISASLARWTTAKDRSFSAVRIVFHAGERPAADNPIAVASDAFAARLIAALPPKPQPTRDHPYWLEQRRSFNLERGADSPATGLRKLFWAVLGRAPEVRPWHPFWHDYRAAMTTAREWVAVGTRMLVIHDGPSPLVRWLTTRGADTFSIGAVPAAGARYDGALIVVGPKSLPQLASAVDAAADAMAPGATVAVHLSSSGGGDMLIPLMIRYTSSFHRPAVNVERCVYSSSRTQWLTHRLYSLAARLFTRGGAYRAALALAVLAPTLALSLTDNLLRNTRRVRGHCSAVTVALRKRA